MDALNASRETSVWLRLENLAALVATVAGYRFEHGSWLWFAVLFLLPDLSMLGYLANPRVGAICYNVVHSYFTPAVLAAGLWLLNRQALSPLWLIWPAHIALDRTLGYGLKYRSGFGDTHLGKLGRAK